MLSSQTSYDKFEWPEERIVFEVLPRKNSRAYGSGCGVKAEMIPWANGNSQLTLTIQWYLAGWAKDLSWARVASKFKVSWDSVCRSVEMAVEWGLDHPSPHCL